MNGYKNLFLEFFGKKKQKKSILSRIYDDGKKESDLKYSTRIRTLTSRNLNHKKCWFLFRAILFKTLYLNLITKKYCV